MSSVDRVLEVCTILAARHHTIWFKDSASGNGKCGQGSDNIRQPHPWHGVHCTRVNSRLWFCGILLSLNSFWIIILRKFFTCNFVLTFQHGYWISKSSNCAKCQRCMQHQLLLNYQIWASLFVFSHQLASLVQLNNFYFRMPRSFVGTS